MSAQNAFLETDLVANSKPLIDSNGIVHTPLQVDPHLLNPWGVGESGGSPFWVSDNNAGVSTLYNTAGTPLALVVSIPAPGDPLGSSGTPTGLVFNINGGATGGFRISGFTKAGAPVTASAIFLFSTEDGTILGWNPNVNPAGFDPAKAGTYAIIAVDNSAVPDAANGAVYKGLAIATDSNGRTLLYATNFRSGKLEVYDNKFATPSNPALPFDAFTDPKLKTGYAPFNIVSANGKLFVTYAVQDETRHDDVAGQSHGIVDTFNLDGSGQRRFAQHGQLNSPWGVAVAPASFGQFAGDILIGNFGNGHINVYSPGGEFLDKLRDPNGQAIVIDGLWTLRVGNGGNGGDLNKVYFTAGPNGETDGLFGSLSPQ
ncbi:MAG: TIGR03118 family protein [Acidobacteria bacterium]|nr:MAG: TIGR03118 family protein [Acidobacteriota bacterium]